MSKMSPKKKNGSRKDPLKSPKVWERARREKMKIYFNELQEVLPFYDPSNPMSRFEILQKSKVYIKDLQDQNQELLNGGFDEVYKIKMTKLKQRVKELLRRIDQLTDLLRTAKIMIPPLEAYPEGMKSSSNLKWMSQRPKKWTEKINLVVPDDKIKNILTLIKDYKKNSGNGSFKKKQASEKLEGSLANESSLQKTLGKKKKVLKKHCKIVNVKTPLTGKSYKKNNAFSELQSPSQFKENQPVDFNLLTNIHPDVGRSNNNTTQSQSELITTSKTLTENSVSQPSTVTEVSSNKVTKPRKLTDTQPNLILPPAPKVVQSNVFILTNEGSLVQIPTLNFQENALSVKPNFFAQTSFIKPSSGLLGPVVINKPSPVIVLQKAPQIIQTAQIINTNPQLLSVSQPSIQILGGSVVVTSSCSTIAPKTLPDILSKAPVNKKRIPRDSTVTTFVNKIPIAALSKQSYTKINSVNYKEKNSSIIARNNLGKCADGESNNEIASKVQNGEKLLPNQGVNLEATPNEKKNDLNAENSHKRLLMEEKIENHKKQKLEENSLLSTEESVFKPIESEAGGMFCNLELPNSINPSLSVSPTAAFLSSFPIVSSSRSEVEDELPERRGDEGKSNSKENTEDPILIPEKNTKENNEEKERKSRDVLEIQKNLIKEKINERTKKELKLTNSNKNIDATAAPSETTAENSNTNKSSMNGSADRIDQMEICKSWNQFQPENCEIRTEAYYLPPENSIQITSSTTSNEGNNGLDINFPGISNINLSFNAFNPNVSDKANHAAIQSTLNDEISTKNNPFEYGQKDNYVNKNSNYNSERTMPKKLCSNNIIDSYSVPKTQSESYQIQSGADYHLIPAKEASNQRNSRTVNWMTEPDNRNRNLIFASQNDKVSNSRANYVSSDNFFINNQITKTTNDFPGHFTGNEPNKTNYQKNEYYIKDQQRCRADRRADPKFCNKIQSSYNIFDYNFSGSCYEDDDSNKFTNVQSCSGKTKKNINQGKKKLEEIQPVVNDHQTSNNATKRLQDQIITNIDFNPVASQECFTWVPGKNVEWLPGKSFGLDSNLVVPSTLPTLVGDLALGTNPASEGNQNKNLNSKNCQTNLKGNGNELAKDYLDLNMGHNSNLSKTMEPLDSSRQYLEPFANLSKNIFDVTPSINNTQPPKNDFDKIHFSGSNNNETIVLKNIFELPVSKCSGGDFSTRSKQRTLNNPQNTFLSVSQLVEPPSFEANSVKNDDHIEATASKDLYAQNYGNYNQKMYKSKNRSSHCKYSDRKYQNYKNVGSSYTAEALIRSNSNLNYQTNEFGPEVNINFFNSKSTQKVDQLPNNKIDFDMNMKSDFGAGPGQNIYSDFNFSSPVPNFTIGPTVATDFVNHDSSTNFSAQNNSFLGDFIAPEFPLSENVSNSLLLPACSIALQNPFVIDKRNVLPEKNKTNTKYCSGSRNRKHFDCSKTSFTEFPIPSNSAIFTTSSLPCPAIFTTSAGQNLLPVPTQNIPISFSSPSFTTSNISFPSLPSTANTNYHINSSPNSTSASFLSSNAMLTTCVSKPLPSSHNCYSSKPATNVSNSVISSSFPVGNSSFSASSQSAISFFSLSNPIIPSSVPTSSSNSLANFNLSTIFPEINQKGNYHYS